MVAEIRVGFFYHQPEPPVPPAFIPEFVAAIDLGSNSFHLIIARLRQGELIVVDRLREMVRLAAGLTSNRYLTPEAQQKAIDCLQRFGQRLRDMPPGSVRAVGTNTLRIAANAGQFLLLAEQALGHPIEIISGIEEARLIYLGVAHSLATDGKRRLVMDIGGGSTEYIIGVDKMPLQKESLRMGCVSMSLSHFPDGKISAKRYKRAVIAAQMELEPFEKTFRTGAWSEAVGASGTLRTVEKLLISNGWSKEGITPDGLNHLVEALLSAGHHDKLQFPDLSADRKPILPGGLAIIQATFKSLHIEHMKVADGALREGLLHDLLGRINHEDVRTRTVTALAGRYHVDQEHSANIRHTLRDLASQLPPLPGVDRETAEQWLDWAAELHEIGLDIAHSQYHKHSAYIIENGDLPGFSRQDQKLLAMLVRSHRRKFSTKSFKELVKPWDEVAHPLSLVLRLAVLLHRSRQATRLPSIALSLTAARLQLRFPKDWLTEHPLTAADLEQEAEYLLAAGIVLEYG
ncbi:MAG: exopolyphosphatase [Methylococcaceae bacterium]|nr:exopolyphosphatase [Methylococcaceae bacterium]